LVIQEGIKAGKVGCAVQMADEVFCGVVRKWVQAGFTLVKAADVGIYMDVVDASELISAHITASPSQAVRLPCAENYPTVLADRAADDEVLFDAARSRLVEEQRTHQTKALKGAAAAHAGGGDPPTAGPPPDGGDVGAGGGGVGSGGGAGKGSPKRSAGEKRRASVERQVKAALEAAGADEEAWHSSLSGNPGGVPAGGGTLGGPGAAGSARFECPSTTKAAASCKDPKGEGNLPFYRRCVSWPVVLGKQGKPFNGQVRSCVGKKGFFHGAYPDDLKIIDTSVLANICQMGGCVLLPMTETVEKQKAAHDLLMANGATRTAEEWKTRSANQKFGESEKAVHVSELKSTVEIAPDFVLRPPDPAADVAGLESLIAANGGASAMSANLREDEAPLAAALSSRADVKWLVNSYSCAGVATLGVAATIDLGEPEEAAQRMETLMCVARSKLLTDVPDSIGGAARGITSTRLEALSDNQTTHAPSLLFEGQPPMRGPAEAFRRRVLLVLQDLARVHTRRRRRVVAPRHPHGAPRGVARAGG
jgi:hypothetical protein